MRCVDGKSLWQLMSTTAEQSISSAKGKISWQDFAAVSYEFGLRLKREFPTNPRLIIQTADPVEFLVMVSACLVAGIHPILDPLGRSKMSPCHPPLEWSGLARCNPLTSIEETAKVAQISPPGLYNSHNDEAILSFCTSGSTGDGVLVEKSWRCLLAEASTLSGIFAISSNSTVTSLVPPFHIYGFLYSFLLPLSLQAHSKFIEPRNGLIPEGRSDQHSLLILTPSTWNIAVQSGQVFNHPQIVTSGAAFGSERQSEYRALHQSRSVGRLFEVLGSTESGGIAYRDASVDSEGKFTLLPSVAVAIDGDVASVSSDFIFPSGHTIVLSDRVELVGTSQLIHKGRADKVVKIGAQRYSLAEIEKNLGSTFDSTIKCAFIEDANHPKGGELLAFVSKELKNYRVERKNYLQHFVTPFPDRIYSTSVQADAMGKISIAELVSQSRLISQ